MILLNFAHPLTADQQAQLEALGWPVDDVRQVPTQLDLAAPFANQVQALVDAAGLTPEQWLREILVLSPPALSSAAVAVLAEVHRRMGRYPPILRLCQVPGAMPPRYKVAEVMDLGSSFAPLIL